MPDRVLVTLTPRPTLPSDLGGASDHAAGPVDAYLTLVMYADFQCEPCVDVARTLLVLRERYAGEVRVIFRHFPQADHDKALLAAQAAEAASDQGRFWQMHDLLFAEQARWRALPPDAFRVVLVGYATQIGLPDVPRFTQTLESGRYAALVNAARQEALALGLKGVPALLFNGLPYAGFVDEYALDGYTRQRLLEKRWFAQQPALQIDLGKRYTATLVTPHGEVVIDLLTQDAPVAVNNFVFLARQGWYDGITWHLVSPGFLAQTGDPSGTGYGIAGYSIADEMDNGLGFDRPGRVAMARLPQTDRPHSTSSQFFITYAPLEPRNLYDGQYTIFGQVTSGLEVLAKLTPRDPLSSVNPPPGDGLMRVTISEGP
jgi:cyclophilin family peptidyl-prolyl cis-trans isomerase/protein-disulfide isomerase